MKGIPKGRYTREFRQEAVKLAAEDMESFWGIIKQELINHRHYRTRREAIEDITEYIEIFYNRQRRQARLGFLSPVAYAQKYYAGLVAA